MKEVPRLGNGSRYTDKTVTLRPSQRKRLDDSNITRIVTGGMERITYKEKVNGVTVIRTRWRQKKKKERRKHS